MSDASLRQQERHSGDADAEVRLLAQRLRSGLLSSERVELAAWVGHPACSRALDVPDRPPLPLGDVILGLERWGHPALVRGLLALGRRVAPRLPEAQRVGALALCEHVQAWLDQGGNSDAREAMLSCAREFRMDAVIQAASELVHTPAGTLDPEQLRGALWHAMDGVSPESAQDAAIMAVGLTAWITAQAVPPPDRQRSLRRFVSWIRRAGASEADMRDALCAELSSWALD